ncbi:MAG: amidohydrolase family protein [Desulfuromonadales bacterium]|nr:amidohydrolase family protein [Desulfuromonadales bacterium]MDH4006449.1 amidohydrolase family protein [Desulfuromonadales bacterium]
MSLFNLSIRELVSFWRVLFCCAVVCAFVPTIALAQKADQIYFGGSLLTMEGDRPVYAEALAVTDGNISFVGKLSEALALKDDATQMHDLQGKALLPGFIDSHGHAMYAGILGSTANLFAYPDGHATDIPSLISTMNDWQKNNAELAKMLGWIVGFGYDDALLSEGRHPTASDLDLISKDRPVMMIHQSVHMSVVNHKGLELLGYTAETPDPSGGVIHREADGKTPNGVLEEHASLKGTFMMVGGLSEKARQVMGLSAIERYKSYGWTTIQEGGASPSIVASWRKIAENKPLEVDVAAYPILPAFEDYLKKEGVRKEYLNGFRVAGAKIIMDGAVQNKTAYLTKPYFKPPPGQDASYRAYPAYDDEVVNRVVHASLKADWPLLAHTNGDAAGDQLINAVSKARRQLGKTDNRTVMIHAQTARDDQLDRMKLESIIPSFFTLHTYYWGDWHREETLGAERTARISPTQSALRRKLAFTTHHDAPVTPPSSIRILAATVNRVSRSGKVIGEAQRVSTYVALKSLTDWAAYQYFEEDRKGTLTKGKLADFVILDQNPLDLAPEKLNDLQVVSTVKEGRVIYRKD